MRLLLCHLSPAHNYAYMQQDAIILYIKCTSSNFSKKYRCRFIAANFITVNSKQRKQTTPTTQNETRAWILGIVMVICNCNDYILNVIISLQKNELIITLTIRIVTRIAPQFCGLE